MKISFENPDKNFDLRTVSNEKIFNALKPEIVQALRVIKGFENIGPRDVQFNDRYSSRKETFAKDGMIYPHIMLDLTVKTPLGFQGVSLFVNTYTIEFSLQKYEAPRLEDEKLTAALVGFMEENFPGSDYLDKKAEYEKNIALMQRQREKQLFFVSGAAGADEMEG